MIKALVRLIKIKVDDKGHCPKWLGHLIVAVYGSMWWYHDMIHSRIWGRGAGQKLLYNGIGLVWESGYSE